ncbi:tRNA (adenosine(37)-N6)-threonylcarbamoyltransferase complex ATPase subunit type 1 TsaE [Taibaiella koreensis]|uniref:tRNA (adenosine(37)-N6)-threonylcarbamoyltransferase complex ATPase subunit type 1 TsaE n=1 Tax=Taibaiella koreensis TaxID=1268548 RepID=UPI001968C604|nr:tRNA (adenosine(37)-N6)-threonylcarbamoyltransferase complex ATPase subunit type 1 TsaE [Taibaiella koreensis]
MQISYTLSNIQAAADQFWQYAHQYRVITFNGGLGAGKTTFTRALCALLGVVDVVSSPTFSLINEYHFKDAEGHDRLIYHSDWYRLRDEEEAIQAGIEDMLSTADSWCFIEWAERAPGLLPQHYLEVHFNVAEDDSRTLVLKKH